MAPGFELMGWLKQAGAQAGPPAEQPAPPAPQAGQATGAAPVAAASARIVAPHSQAAAALAAALSAGGVPEKKHPQPHGSRISPMQEVVEVDRIRPESAAALVVSKIANYPSEISRRHGHAIAVDANYICYGLKGGQIRILNRHTAARTLLKDHAAPVTDLRFFRHDSERCLLASVDTTGQVHVRKVYEEDADGEDTVRDEILARHELPIPTTGPGAHPPARLAWHPNYDFVLAVAAGPTVYLINVPPTADVAAAPEYSAPVAAARSADGAVMTSVAFSPAGDLLAAGDARGFVYVWALTPEQLDPALIQPLATEPDIRFQAYGSAPGEAPYGDGTGDSASVVSLNWMSRGGNAGNGEGGNGGGEGCEGSSNGGTPLVLLTGDGINAHLKLWTIDLSSKPQCTHAISLTSAATPGGGSAAFFNHLEAQPLYDCVVLANELRNHVYVLHVDPVSQPDGPTFDYVSEFSVKMPILSYTLAPEAFLDEATDAEAFKMYTIQSDAVQQYTLVPAQCFPMPAPTGPGAGALGSGPAVSASGTFGHNLLPAGSGIGGGLSTAMLDGAATTRASKDPLAALLALQQQQQRQMQQQEKLRDVVPVVPLTQPPSALVGMPSDVSDATSPLLPAGAEGSPHVGLPGAADAAAHVADGANALAQVEPSPLAVPQEAEVAHVVASEAAAAAGVAESTPAIAQAVEAVAELPAGEVAVPARPSLLLTPSQLMQSAAAAAAAARSVASSSASAAGLALTSAALHELYGTGAVAPGDGETVASTAGTSRSHSLPTASNALTPSASEVNLAAAAEAAAAEVVAAAEGEAEEAAARADIEESRAAPAAAAVKALPLAAAALAAAPLPAQGPQPSPTSMPPPPSELLVRRVSQSKSGSVPPLPTEVAQRPASAPPLPASPSGSTAAVSASGSAPVAAEPDAAAAAATSGEIGAAAAAAAPTLTSASASAAPLPQVTPMSILGLHASSQQQQEALGKLVALQEQLLEQVSAGHRELLKVVRSEAQRNAKAAADAAATRAAEAVARKAAEERRKESTEMQKALTGAINHLGKDLSQRVADAAAATTAAVKAAIGPAVRAAVAEALPAALSAGSTAAALERALGSQLSAALPRAVADGLGAAFTAQVVPPLERATSTMFGQIEAALRTGLDIHLAPLGPLAGLGGQLRDAASQVQAAAKSLKSEAAAVQQMAAAAAATASRSTASAASQVAPAAAPAPAANASGGGAKSAGRGSAAAQQQQPAVAPPASSTSRSAATEASAVAAAAAAAAAVVNKAAPAAARALSATPPTAAAARAEPMRAESVPASAAPPVSVATPAAPVSPPASVDVATREMILGLIRRGDLDGALSRVLERQDLPLVLWACSEAGGAGVLAAEPCPLGQPTLLSLLTFLSYDLTSDVDLKLGWIEAILKRLDVREPRLAPHIRGVLDSVKAALAVIARGGTGATAAKAKQAVHQAIGLITMLS